MDVGLLGRGWPGRQGVRLVIAAIAVVAMSLVLAPGSASAQAGRLAGSAPGVAAAAWPSGLLPPLPSRPALSGVTPGNQSVSVRFIPPLGIVAPILNYQYSLDGGVTWKVRSPASAASPIVITGLTNGRTYQVKLGRTYQVKLRAVNSVGAGAQSGSVTVTPIGVPGAPTALVPTALNQSASVKFVAPASNGGRVISNYQYSLDSGVTWKVRTPASTVSPIVITGLTNGRTYQVKLRAVNSAGRGAASVSVAVVPRAVMPSGLVTSPGE